ncbi:potassium-transporting ATPase subunit KdpA [uncultured Clostridium sp.]|uniref:potassium-transporting ATPase subunit KdpA n=1 Tax=uncultured Clostridium sp. TaxID=59620 RepID=UPI00261DBC78|nr:potassium-transporting ATPase subunit KdpA [uncultured Clostridium sp.]
MVGVQLILFLIVFLVLIAIVGKYISNIINFRNYKTNGFFDKIDNCIYKVCGIRKESMSFKEYAKALLISNFFMFLLGFIILKIQGLIPIFNSASHAKNFSFSLAFNTAASFVTNTDLQHYAGASAVSNFTQMLVITFLMFTSAATGCAIAAGFIRTVAGKEKTLGNFYVDFTRFLTRLLIPFSIVIGIILIFCGVPQSLKGIVDYKTITGSFQSIMLGPIASLEAIKHLGTNGGGFFAANSAHPFSNPSIITNYIEMISMTIIPGSFIVAFGDTVKNKKQAIVIIVALLVLVAVSFAIMYCSITKGNAILQHMGLSKAMSGSEGQELRFGNLGTSLFSTITTTFTTGSTNVALNAMNPMFIFATLWGMMLNTLFGGDGVGFLNIIMYVLLTAFICGLMVGRTPEFFGKKVEAKEIKLIAVAILIHPILVLFSTVITLLGGFAATAGVHSGFHGFTQVLYEFTSASANNGSLMGGYMNNNAFFNIITGVIMLIGRFAPILLLLGAAVSLANKKAVPKTVGTFRTDNVIFGVMLIVIILVIGALTFLPVLGLGPITEHLRFLA